MLIKSGCLKKLIQGLEKSEAYSLLIAVYGIFIFYLHTAARNVAILSDTATKIFHCNLHDIV
jgi:hypothetical protein